MAFGPKPQPAEYRDARPERDVTALAAEAPVVGHGRKSTAVACALALVIGMTGAHNVSLGRAGALRGAGRPC